MADPDQEQEKTLAKKPGVAPTPRPPTDLRRHRARTDRTLVIGGFAILFVVGGGLIWLLYGRGAALVGWTCMGSGVLLFGLLLLLLKLMEKV